MTTELRIGPELSLPLEAVTQTFGILAKRGSGKTYTAAVMVEEMLSTGMPVCVIDPIGVWWGLRSSADGKGAGEPVVIFGGDHADVPLTETSGQLIADVIIDNRVPAVLDLSLLSKGASRRFMTDFAERLYHRNRDPLHLVIDEADAFAPQRTQHGGERLLGAIEDLVRRGRARGLGITMITQRPAVLNKDVLTQIEVLVVLRMTGPLDVKAIDEWVRGHAEEDEARTVKASLPSLPIGTAWVWSPGWLGVLAKVHVRKRRTFDSSATPKAGETRREPKARAEIDLTALGEQISATVEQAKADDPKALRARIRDLEKQVATKTAPVVERVEVPAIDDETLKRLEGLRLEMEGHGVMVTQAAEQVQAQLAVLRRPTPSPERVMSPSRASGPTAPSRQERPTDAGDAQLRSGARRMVEALGRMAPLRLTKSQWGTVAKLKTSGGTWSTYLGDIRRAGLIDENAPGYTLTDAGFEYLGGRPAPMTPTELQDHYRSILRSGAVKMLDAIMAAYPAGLSREEIGAAAEITTTGGTFSTYLGDLTRNGLVDKRDGEYVATEILMHGADA
jgi:hypothetical protein